MRQYRPAEQFPTIDRLANLGGKIFGNFFEQGQIIGFSTPIVSPAQRGDQTKEKNSEPDPNN